MSQQIKKPFQAMVSSTASHKNFEFLGEAIDYLRKKKGKGIIFERDDSGEFRARYVIQDGDIVSLRGLTGKMLHEAIFND